MKTDKLLQLFQQKKFMRSGGALPLPKAQSGNKGQCPEGQMWSEELQDCVLKNVVVTPQSSGTFEGKQFMEDWTNSPMAQEMLKKSILKDNVRGIFTTNNTTSSLYPYQTEYSRPLMKYDYLLGDRDKSNVMVMPPLWEMMKDLRLQNMNSVDPDIYTFKELNRQYRSRPNSMTSGVPTIVGQAYHDTENAELFNYKQLSRFKPTYKPKGYREMYGYEPSNPYTQLLDQRINPDTAYVKLASNYENGTPMTVDEMGETSVHEYSHIGDMGNDLIPLSDLDLMSKYALINSGDPNKFTDFQKYVSDPTETRARLNEIRFALNKKNIYNPFKQRAFKGMFDNVDYLQSLDDLRKVYSDDQIIDMLNTISRNEPDQNQMLDNIQYAKEGGSLPRAQSGYEQAKARYITARSKGVMGQHEMEQLVNQFPQLINDPSVAGIVSQFNRTKNQEPITLEEKIDKKLKYPQKRAVKTTDEFEIDRQIKGLEGMPTDNLRHALASRYTAENIQQQFPSFLKPTGIPQFTGFLGANALGLGHEIMTYYNNPNRSDRPLWETVRESGEDMYNNAFGSAVGVMPFLSDDQKTNIIQNAVINKKIPDGQHYGEFDINNYKNTNNTQKQKKGGLTKAQGGKEKLPEGFMSYESNPGYFDNHAVYHDNARYNDQIRSMVYSGKAAFNPTTGELRFIKGKPADAATQQMATEDYTRGVRRDPTDTQYAGADKRTKQIIQNTTKTAFENPLMYAPGMIGMSMLPMGWNVGYGLGQSGILGAQGDYKNAALTAGLSALPFVGQSVVPRVLQSNITPRLLGQNLTNRLFESHISPTNWTNYQIADDLGKGGFGSAYTFKNFPKHVWKMSDAKRVDDIIGVDFNKYRFEDIPRPVGNEYPIYHKSFINAENPKSTAAFLEWEDKFKSGSDIPKFNFELMSKVEGTPFFNLSSKQITGIPQSSWQGLKNTLEKLRVNDVGFDIQGHGNLIYNPETKSFGVIDLTPGASTSKSGWQSHVLSDVNKNMSYDDATNAFKEIFKNKGNYRLKQIQTDIGRRINNNLIKNSGLDAWNQANLQLKLSKTPPVGNADYMNYHNLIKNRWQSTVNNINSVQRKGGTLRRAQSGNEGEDPLEQIKKWYAANPDQKPKADQTPKSNNILGNKRQSDKQIMQGINDQAMLEYQQKESERIKGVASQYNMNPLDVKIQEDRFTALRNKRAKELEDGKSFREVGQTVNGQYIPSDVELGFKIPDAAATGIADPLNWPAIALTGAAALEGLTAAGMAALPYTTPIMDALSAPAVVGGTEIPWLTGQNIMGAGFAGHVPGDIERGDYLSAALNSMPIWLNPSTIRFGANAINEGRTLFNQSKNAATQFGNRVILSKPVQSTMDVLNPGRILKQMREPETLSSKIDTELWKSKNRLIDIERNRFDNQYQKIKNYFYSKNSNDPNFVFLQNQLGKYRGILKNEKIFSQNVSNLGENGLLITEGSPFSRAVTTGETEIFDFATGKKIKVKVQLPGTSGAMLTKEGDNVVQSTFGNNQITPIISENLVPTLKSNNAWLESNTGGKVFGSSRGVSDADLVHIPDDAEVLISQTNYEKNVANKYPLVNKGENVVTHELANGQGMIGTKNKGEVGFVIVEQNGAGKATGRRAEELFRQTFPEEYFKLNRESIKTGKPMEIPYTPDELINGIKPEVKTVMDSMEINTALPGKGKHTLRPDVYINYGDVEVVTEAQQRFIKSIVGEKGTVGPQFTVEQLSDVGQNKVVLKTIGFRGDINLVAADPKRMQLALNDYYINRTTLSRGVGRISNSGKILTPEEIEAAFKDWDPHAQGGMAMGAGQNHVVLGNSGVYGYDFYGHKQVGLNNLKTDNVLDFVNSIENQTSGLKTFSQEEREIVKSILDKYSFNGSFRGYIPNSGNEFISAVATDIPLDKMRAVLKEYSDLTGKRIITTTDYGESIYTSTLTDFDETLDAVEYFISKDNQTGKVIAPVPTSARTRNDYYKQTTQLDLNKVFPNTNLKNKTEKEIFYMIKNKLKDINLKLDHTMGKTNNKIAELDHQIQQIEGRIQRKIENVKQSAINKNKGIDRSEEVNELHKKIANLEIERAAYQQQIDDLSKKYSRYVKVNQKLGYMIGAPAILGASIGIAYGGLELIKKVDQNIKEDEKEKMKEQYDQSLKLSDKEFTEKFGFSKKEASTFEQFYKSIYEPGEDRRAFLRKRSALIKQQREQKKREEDAKQQKLDSTLRSQFNFNNLFK
jgi:hypothetical protein